MPSDAVLRVRNLCKSFKLYPRARDRLLELLPFSGPRHRDFQALHDISFELAAGEAIGIIGENGSGKSTLLKLIAGILLPDAGVIQTRGRITGLLELGTGFNAELSGRRNIYANGLYLQLSPQFLRQKEEEIIAFAELGQFIDEPLKSYSSGMIMRLGFAIAIHAQPRCFIIDEALSVGDIRFQQKCFDRMRQFRASGGSILFVSHDLNAVRLFCDRVLLLDAGRVRFRGDPETGVNQFNELMAAKGDSGAATRLGYGNGAVQFTSVRIEDVAGNPVSTFTSGQPARFRFGYRATNPVSGVTFGITLRDRFGQDIFGSNGFFLHTLADVDGSGEGSFNISALNINKGVYTVNLAAHTGMTHLENCFHWWDNAASFEVLEDIDYRFGGIARLAAKLELQTEHGEKI